MTAPIGTVANRFTGIREVGQVTNTYGGYFTSAGAAATISLPFQPDRFDWFRRTAFGTAGTLGQGVWFRDFSAATTLALRSIADNGSTGNTSLLLDTTNGITTANTTGGFVDEHLTITGITTANPGVVTTSANHGLTTNDRVIITKVIGTMAAQINNHSYVVQVLSATTFSLYDDHGNPINVTGAYTSSGQVTKMGPRLGITDTPVVFRLTLGTTIMGANNDVIFFTAYQFNNYVNVTPIA